MRTVKASEVVKGMRVRVEWTRNGVRWIAEGMVPRDPRTKDEETLIPFSDGHVIGCPSDATVTVLAEPDPQWVEGAWYWVKVAGIARDGGSVSDLGATAREISHLIDSTYPPTLDREAWAWRRVMKVAEEVGEVNEAMLGWRGENPRKGYTHTVDDVRQELLDVALAALAACVHLDDNSDPLEDLDAHARRVRDRLMKALDSEATR